jgi:hypothetical protein
VHLPDEMNPCKSNRQNKHDVYSPDCPASLMWPEKRLLFFFFDGNAQMNLALSERAWESYERGAGLPVGLPQYGHYVAIGETPVIWTRCLLFRNALPVQIV